MFKVILSYTAKVEKEPESKETVKDKVEESKSKEVPKGKMKLPNRLVLKDGEYKDWSSSCFHHKLEPFQPCNSLFMQWAARSARPLHITIMKNSAF